ncbi:MAG: hypothetical protein IJD90_04795 [Clostridia bacterium]|nr:hypothetical protein [Clostridia bacterium]
METLCYVIFLVLSLIGITTLIKQLCFLIFKKDCLKKSVFLIYLDDKNYENTIVSAYYTLKWQGVAKNVLAFGEFLSESNKTSALKLLKNYNFSFCDEKTINNKLKDIFNE